MLFQLFLLNALHGKIMFGAARRSYPVLASKSRRVGSKPHPFSDGFFGHSLTIAWGLSWKYLVNLGIFHTTKSGLTQILYISHIYIYINISMPFSREIATRNIGSKHLGILNFPEASHARRLPEVIFFLGVF